MDDRTALLNAIAECHVRCHDYAEAHIELTSLERAILRAATAALALVAELLDPDGTEPGWMR